jgi:hypothetical protein
VSVWTHRIYIRFKRHRNPRGLDARQKLIGVIEADLWL